MLGLSPVQMLDAFGSAGTQASGLWEFLRDAADSKQLHTAMASANGLMAATLAADGFKGATRILEGEKGMAAGMSTDADPPASPTVWANVGRSPRPRSSITLRVAILIPPLTRCSQSWRSMASSRKTSNA